MHFSLSILLFGNVVISRSQNQHLLLPASLSSSPEFVGIESVSSEAYPGILSYILIPVCVQCRLLSKQLPGLVTYPVDHGYKVQESQYWSLNQVQQKPKCRIAPETVNDVAKVIEVLRYTKSLFAVKGGGHSSVVNASNVDGGVTTDLFKLSGIIVAPNRKSVFVSSGARWRDVYHQLDAHNLGVSGARAGSVGVGGYLLGGRLLRML